MRLGFIANRLKHDRRLNEMNTISGRSSLLPKVKHFLLLHTPALLTFAVKSLYWRKIFTSHCRWHHYWEWTGYLSNGTSCTSLFSHICWLNLACKLAVYCTVNYCSVQTVSDLYSFIFVPSSFKNPCLLNKCCCRTSRSDVLWRILHCLCTAMIAIIINYNIFFFMGLWQDHLSVYMYNKFLKIPIVSSEFPVSCFEAMEVQTVGY